MDESFVRTGDHAEWRATSDHGELDAAGRALYWSLDGSNEIQLALRILAYRLHAKRFADLLVSICAGLLMVVAYSMPVLLPFLALAILWQLQRRAAARTWLLA